MTSHSRPSVDLVERLRGHAYWLHENHGHRPSGMNPIGADCEDAAREIERLRYRVGLLEDVIVNNVTDDTILRDVGLLP